MKEEIILLIEKYQWENLFALDRHDLIFFQILVILR